MTKYKVSEVRLAMARFHKATGGGEDFFVWLGFERFERSSLGLWSSMATYDSETDKRAKMEAALSPHWHALIKASIARKDKK